MSEDKREKKEVHQEIREQNIFPMTEAEYTA